MAALRGTCEDGCGQPDRWVRVRSSWELLCDDCANARGVMVG